MGRTRAGCSSATCANGGVFCLSPSGQVSVVVEHREGDRRHGAPPADGGLIVLPGRNIGYKGPASAETVVLLDPRDAEAGVVGFNDLTTDAAGRIYVGSLAPRARSTRAQQQSPSPGCAPRDRPRRHPPRRLADGILLTNGLGFSPDGRRLYHSDSPREASSGSTTSAPTAASAYAAPSCASNPASPTASRCPRMERSGWRRPAAGWSLSSNHMAAERGEDPAPAADGDRERAAASAGTTGATSSPS